MTSSDRLDLSAFLSVAVRAWTVPRSTTTRRSPHRPHRQPEIHHALVLDTETTLDAPQALLFGAFRYCRIDGTTVTTVAEGLIHPDDLSQSDVNRLRRYARSHKADVDMAYLAVEPHWELQLMSRRAFVDRWLWHVGYPHNHRRDPAMIVMFNAPFDLSRLAVAAAEARADMHGGFSLTLWTDEHGQPAAWRPRVAVKSLDSKRALKKFRRLERGNHDFAGHLLDLRTLVFALTGASHSLDSACTTFGVPGKAVQPPLGQITDDTIDYCRQDVAATTALLQATLREYATHPIELQPTVAYSPASLAKAYLRAMGVQSRLQAQPDFPPAVLGYAMSAFYGGRAEVHLRHLPVPIALVDFTSMYPTVDTLMNIWPLVTARQIDIIDVTDEVTQLLGSTALEDWFHPEAWKQLLTIVQIDPDGEVVPIRAGYRDQDWSIGVNPLHADEPFWFTLPDLVASTLLSSRPPRIRRALRFVPAGTQPGLQPIKLRGEVLIDPNTEDFLPTRGRGASASPAGSARAHVRDVRLREVPHRPPRPPGSVWRRWR